jgi:hypothetical protein
VNDEGNGAVQRFGDGAWREAQNLAIGGEKHGFAVACDDGGEIGQELHSYPV